MILFNFSEPNRKRQKMDSLPMDLNEIIKSINDYSQTKGWECALERANFKDIKSLEDEIEDASRKAALILYEDVDRLLQGSTNWERFCLYLTHDWDFRAFVLKMFCQEFQLSINSMVTQARSMFNQDSSMVNQALLNKKKE